MWLTADAQGASRQRPLGPSFWRRLSGSFQSQAAVQKPASVLKPYVQDSPLVCPHCGGAMRIITLITDGPTVRDRSPGPAGTGLRARSARRLLVNRGCLSSARRSAGSGHPRNAEKHPCGDAQPLHRRRQAVLRCRRRHLVRVGLPVRYQPRYRGLAVEGQI